MGPGKRKWQINKWLTNKWDITHCQYLEKVWHGQTAHILVTKLFILFWLKTYMSIAVFPKLHPSCIFELPNWIRKSETEKPGFVFCFWNDSHLSSRWKNKKSLMDVIIQTGHKCLRYGSKASERNASKSTPNNPANRNWVRNDLSDTT